MSLIQEALRRQHEEVSSGKGPEAAASSPSPPPAPPPASAPAAGADKAQHPKLTKAPKLGATESANKTEPASPALPPDGGNAQGGSAVSPPVPEEAAEESARKKAKQKKIVAVAAALVVVIGAGAAAFFLMSGGGSSPEPGGNPEVPEVNPTPAAPPAGNGAGSEPAIKPGPAAAGSVDVKPSAGGGASPPDGASDPVQPHKNAPKEPVVWPILTVKGLMGSGTRGAVVLNSEIVLIGQQIEGVTVVAIGRDTVTLEYKGETRVLRSGDITN